MHAAATEPARRTRRLLAALWVLSAINAASAAVADTVPIASVTFEGNDRTREQVLRRAVDAAPGDPYTEETAEEIRDDLRSLGLFSSVEVAPDPAAVAAVPPADGAGRGGGTEGVDVVVTLEERWTLIPIPFFRAGSSGAAGGLFVLESNLLGYNKQLVGGGTLGSDGFGGFLAYNDPAVLGSRWLFSLSARAGEDEVESATAAGGEEWSHLEDRVGAGASVGYRFGDRVTTRLGADYEYVSVSDSGRPGVVSDGGVQFVTLTAEVGLSDLDPQLFFRSGYRVAVTAEATPGEAAGAFGARATRTWAVFEQHRLEWSVRGGTGQRPFVLRDRLGGRDGQRTIEQGTVAADTWAAGGALYEVPVLTPQWGTITTLAFYEGGYIADADDAYHGGGGGLRLYLSRITFPALGFDIAWNAAYAYPVFSFSFGGRL